MTLTLFTAATTALAFFMAGGLIRDNDVVGAAVFGVFGVIGMALLVTA